MDNSDELKIEVFDDPKIFQSIYNEWLMLIDDCTSTIFSQPEWYYAWWETFGAESRLMFITARVNSRLVGVLPFCARSTGIKDFFSRYIEPVSGTFSDYYSPIIARVL